VSFLIDAVVPGRAAAGTLLSTLTGSLRSNPRGSSRARSAERTATGRWPDWVREEAAPRQPIDPGAGSAAAQKDGVQNVTCVYDPVGNIVSAQDNALKTFNYSQQVAAPTTTQDCADGLDPELTALGVDEVDYFLCWRSSSPRKKLAVSFRISLARLRSRISCSRSLTRADTAVDTPGVYPSSISACRKTPPRSRAGGPPGAPSRARCPSRRATHGPSAPRHSRRRLPTPRLATRTC
jgi:hypothetical protein